MTEQTPSDMPGDDDLRDFFLKPSQVPTSIGKLKSPDASDQELSRKTEAQDATEGKHLPPSGPPALLSPVTRYAMQRLLTRGVVLARSHREDFDQIAGHKIEVERILNELGLNLVIHFGYGMAAIMRSEDAIEGTEIDEEIVDDDHEGGSALVRTTRLKLLHSLILMELRRYYREREMNGDEHVIVDLDTLKERLKPFWPLVNSESRSDRRFEGAIATLERHSILLSVRGGKHQREISPVITLVLDPQRLEIMVSEYKRLAEELETANIASANGNEKG